MGFLATDITPLQSPSPLIPSNKDYTVKVISVARTDTVSSVKAVLPADSSVMNVWLYRNGVSNAATTATVTITIANNSGTISTGTYDVKASGDTSAVIQMNNLPNLQPMPLAGDLTVSAVYAETGTASTSGGPWKISVDYVR